MGSPKIPDGWAWRPCKDGQTGYLDSPTGHTTRRPISIEHAEKLGAYHQMLPGRGRDRKPVRTGVTWRRKLDGDVDRLEARSLREQLEKCESTLQEHEEGASALLGFRRMGLWDEDTADEIVAALSTGEGVDDG